MTFCTICIVWITVCLCVLSAEETIKANVRSTVTLPCKLRVQSETPYIRWSTDVDVFERSGKDFFQGQGYEGRVDISEEKLREGDCSLVLHNLTHTDTGVYMSYQAERRTKRSVKEKWSLLSVVQLSVNGAIRDGTHCMWRWWLDILLSWDKGLEQHQSHEEEQQCLP